MAAFTAGSYAELVGKYPRAGGAGLYVHRAFGLSFLSFIVAFAVVMSGITSASALARAFGGDYLSAFVDVPVVAHGARAARAHRRGQPARHRGVHEAQRRLHDRRGRRARAHRDHRGVALAGGDAEPARAFDVKEDTTVFAAALSGAALAFYALIGFEDSVNVAEETQDPARTYPKALFGGLAIAGTLYLS